MSPEARSGLLGVMVVVLGWAGWSALHAKDAVESAPVAPEIAGVAPVSPPVERVREREAAAPRPLAIPSPPADAGPAEPRLREGFVLEHGVVTAVRASASPRPAPRRDSDDAVLPPGVSPADATVSPGGVVTVNRVTRGTAPENAPQTVQPNPFRPPERMSSP